MDGGHCESHYWIRSQPYPGRKTDVMLIRIALIGSAVVGFCGLVLGFAVSAERLGNWTVAHPEHATVAWMLWNLGLLVIVGSVIIAWRRFRRSAQRVAR